jgi:hypothetical protein
MKSFRTKRKKVKEKDDNSYDISKEQEDRMIKNHFGRKFEEDE